MAYIAPAKETVMIVGGLGDQSGAASDNGGGASLAAWDAFSPSAFMGANGGPFTTDSLCTFTTADKQITKVSSNIGLNVKVGTLCYVNAGVGAKIDAGCYEVTAVPDADTITLGNIQDSGDDTVIVKVGGAINTLQAALDNPCNSATTPVPGYNRYIYDNIATETISNTIDVDTYFGGASTSIFVIGYNATLTAKSEIEITTAATLANGLMLIDGVADYYHWEYIDFNAGGRDSSLAAYGVYSTSNGLMNHSFVKCKFHGASITGLKYAGFRLDLYDCEAYLNGTYGVHTTGRSNHLINANSIHDNDSHGARINSTDADIINNTFYDNGKGGSGSGLYYRNGGDNSKIVGNTSYGNADDGIHLESGANTIRLFNNTASGNGGYGYNIAATATRFFGWNHSYNNTTAHINKVADGSFTTYAEGNNKTGDPEFTRVDDGSEDFTPQTGSSLINNALVFGGTGNNAIGACERLVDYPSVNNVTEDDTVDGNAGVYHEATTAEVEKEVTFGASSGLTGTYEVAAGDPPAAPTVTLAAGTGQVVVTIDGDAGVTNYVKYKGSADTAWQAGGSRSGDGDVTVSNLSNDIPYIIIVFSKDGSDLYSPPALASIVTLTATASNTNEALLLSALDDILDELGESVTYKPAGGGTRDIVAIVIRESAVDMPGMDYISSPMIQVIVKNDSTEGITASEIDTGGDVISLAIRQGEAAQDRRINTISANDAISLTLEVQ